MPILVPIFKIFMSYKIKSLGKLIYYSVVDILTIRLETKGKTHSDTPKHKKYRCKISGVDNPLANKKEQGVFQPCSYRRICTI